MEKRKMGYSDDMKDYDEEVQQRQKTVRVPIRRKLTRKNGRWYLIEEILPQSEFTNKHLS